MKRANEILYEHGIDTGSLNDDFNTQLFYAMERYAEEKSGSDQAVLNEEIARLNNKINFNVKTNIELVKTIGEQLKTINELNDKLTTKPKEEKG